MKTNRKFRKLSKTYDRIEKEAAGIDEAMDGIRRTTVKQILVIGKLLWEANQKLAKSKYTEGVFNAWCRDRLKLKRTTAWKWMTVYDYFGDECSQCEQSYAPSALYLLANRNTPGRIRRQARAFAEKGGKVEHWRVKAWLKDDADMGPRPKISPDDPDLKSEPPKKRAQTPGLKALKEAWIAATDEERERFERWKDSHGMDEYIAMLRAIQWRQQPRRVVA